MFFNFFACAETARRVNLTTRTFGHGTQSLNWSSVVFAFMVQLCVQKQCKMQCLVLIGFLKENLTGCEPGLKRGRHALAGRLRQFWNHGVYF